LTLISVCPEHERTEEGGEQHRGLSRASLPELRFQSFVMRVEAIPMTNRS